MKLIKKGLNDERGVIMIIVAIAIVIIFGFAVLAIDLSLIQLAKTQLQNAADAAALAGAMALATSGGDQAIATAEAMNFSAYNLAVQDIQRPVIITPDDVTFPEPYKITVTTHRAIDRNNPVTLYFLKVLGPENKGEVSAKATATIFPLYGSTCLRPFCPPDRWDDADNDSVWDPADEFVDQNGNDVWDPGEPLTLDRNGNGIWDPAEFYDPYLTGYRAPDDIGTIVTLKLRNSNKDFLASWYYAVDYGPINTGDPVITGANAYRDWIAADPCEPYIVSVGDQLQIEPGNMVGPTAQGLEDLINADPTAEWDEASGTIINSAFPTSPRIIICPAFDPTIGVQSDTQGRKYVTISKLMVLFAEQHTGSDVVGRFMRKATGGDICPDCPIGFLFTVALVE